MTHASDLLYGEVGPTRFVCWRVIFGGWAENGTDRGDGAIGSRHLREFETNNTDLEGVFIFLITN